ncbi:MAG: Type 1 glutamine amidotransferase-like domain-containing protein [Clostridia bacterium]|nr:Type 1 glutamine amidotransferase-like domain-containing protein [Clostridia bacterium]
MKLILSSSDFGNPISAQFIKDNLGKPMEECRVLYFPNEKATEERINSNMYYDRVSALGFQRQNITVFNYYDPVGYDSLEIDAIYISGGNTYGTIDRIREAKADMLIKKYIKNGAVYIGGSAGAHIACANISHVKRYDTNTFNVKDMRGLELYTGILICHYNKDREAHFLELKETSPFRVTALKDGESILVED